MNIYDTSKSIGGGWKNFNLLPYISFYYDETHCFLNVGWLILCIQFKIK